MENNEFELAQWFDTTKRISKSDVEDVCSQIALYDLKDGGSGTGKAFRATVAAMNAAVRLHNEKFPVPATPSSRPRKEVPPELLADLLSVASRKEVAKASRKARAEHISEQEALCAILAKAAGKYPLAKFIGHRKSQQETNRKHAETQRRAEATAWKGWFDGAAAPSNPGPRGIGALLVSPEGDRFEISRATGFGTNNEAEYQAVIALLEAAVERNVPHLIIRGDSQLVLNQISGDWDCNAAGLKGFCSTAKSLYKRIANCSLVWIPREQNEQADALSVAALGITRTESPGHGKPGKNGWGTQSDIGKRLNLSAIAVGKLLDSHGLRAEKLATPSAIDGGFARQYETTFGLKVGWHVAKVAGLLSAKNTAEAA